MKQRSKVSGERGNSRSLKATKRKRSSASNKTPSSASPHASAQAELARLTRELTDERRPAAKHRHSITSSAVARSEGGIVRPISLAVFRLMTSSNRVGCSTGSSAGFPPLRIFAT